MKKGKVEQYKDENFFKNFVVAEDWDGFKKLWKNQISKIKN